MDSISGLEQLNNKQLGLTLNYVDSDEEIQVLLDTFVDGVVELDNHLKKGQENLP